MELNNIKLSKFKHDVDDLLARVLKVQAETSEICRKSQQLVEELMEMIDENEDEEN